MFKLRFIAPVMAIWLLILHSYTALHAAETAHPLITAQNASRLTEWKRLGNGGVSDLAWSPDGRWTAISSSLGTWLFDMDHSGTEPDLILDKVSSSVSFSPDSTTLVADIDSAPQLTLFRYSLVSHKPLPPITIRDERSNLTRLRFSPDGNAIYLLFDVGIARVDISTGKVTARFYDASRMQFLSQISFSPDGSQLIVSGMDARIWVFDKNLTAPLRVYFDAKSGENPATLAISYSSDGAHILSVDTSSAKAWKSLRTFDEFVTTSQIYDAQYSSDRKQLLVVTIEHASGTSSLQLFPSAGGLPTSSFTYPSDHISWMQISADGKRVILLSADDGLHLIDLANGSILAQYPFLSPDVSTLAFSRDGNLLASAGYQGIYLWDIANVKLRHVIQTGGPAGIYASTFSPEGYLVTAGADRVIRFWDVQSYKQVDSLAFHQNSIQRIAFSPDGHTLISGDTSGTLVFWDADHRVFSALRQSAASAIYDIVFLDADLFAVVNYYTMEIWSLQKLEKIQTLSGEKGAPYQFYGLTISPDHRQLFTAREANNSGILWSVGTLEKKIVPAAKFTAAVFSPDSKLLAGYVHEKGPILIDAAKGTLLAEHSRHMTTISSIAFSPDGILIATGGTDNTVRL